MLPLLTAMDQMRATLLTADAPTRQLTGVDVWRAEISVAVSIGSAFPRPAGMGIADTVAVRGRSHPADRVRFLRGQVTHAAWRDLCGAVIDALTRQHAHATRLTKYWLVQARTADTPSAHTYAVEQAQTAVDWGRAAHTAAATGRRLVADEDSIQVPVGRAIQRVGAHDVATDKHYHQRGARR